MTDEQYAALNAKLDAILARLEKLEQRRATITIKPWPGMDEMQGKQMVDMIEQELGKRVRNATFGGSNGGVF